MCAWLNSEERGIKGKPGDAERRALGLLLEGAVVHQPQIDSSTYARFRSAILRSSIRLVEPQSESELLSLIAMLIGEFETYRAESEACVEARQKEWRHTVHALTFLLAQQFQLDPRSSRLSDVTLDLSAAVTSEQVEALRAKLQNLFQRMEETATTRQQEEIEEQDRSLANDNAAGLRGGGAAIEHLRSMIAANRPGYVGLFRLSCLDVVGERFGVEGTQDCLMAVSAFLTGNLRHEDSVYHWSETSLLAICDRKVREDMIHAELNRILARNRDFTIKIGDRTIMLRIPIELQLFPLAHFTSADDLQSFPFTRVATGRSLSEQANAR